MGDFYWMKASAARRDLDLSEIRSASFWASSGALNSPCELKSWQGRGCNASSAKQWHKQRSICHKAHLLCHAPVRGPPTIITYHTYAPLTASTYCHLRSHSNGFMALRSFGRISRLNASKRRVMYACPWTRTQVPPATHHIFFLYCSFVTLCSEE